VSEKQLDIKDLTSYERVLFDKRIYILITDIQEYRVKFEVREINGWTVPEGILQISGDIFFTTSIKWDGCMDCSFGDEDGYIHFCESSQVHMIPLIFDELRKIVVEKLDSTLIED
jgi:hypothetical protein